MSDSYSGNGVISDDEEDFVNEEDRSNKVREMSRIDEEVLKRQREIELLLKKKQQEAEALVANEEQQKLKRKAEYRKRQKQEEYERRKAEKEKIDDNKNHILSKKSSFASKLSNTRNVEKAENQVKKEFMKSRKYAFGLDKEEVVLTTAIDVDELEKYSGQMINKRYIDKHTLELIMDGKKILRLEKLFAEVRPPDFEEPQYPNWVAVGIIVSKDEVKKTADSKSKFLKLSISNFIYSINLLLFSEAFNKYWKLQVGDVIGILNPRVSPYKNPKTGKTISFSLILSGGFDSIVEIGRSKNFGKCKSYKKNSRTEICGIPVDKSKSEYCEYHQNMSLKKIVGNRLELGGISTSGGPNKMKNTAQDLTILMNKNYKSNDAKSFGIEVVSNPYASKFHNQEDLNMGKIYFSNINAKKAFFDEDYVNPDAVNNIDIKRKKIANKKKEMELRNKLSNFKGGEFLKSSIIFDEDTKDLRSDKVDKNQIAKNSRILQAAYSSKQINALGFDPTRKMFGSHSAEQLHLSDISDSRGRAKEKIKSLDDARKSKRFRLSPSRESKLKRSKTWNENFKKLKKYKKGVEHKEDFENYLSDEFSSAPSSAFSSPANKKTIQRPISDAISSKNLLSKLKSTDKVSSENLLSKSKFTDKESSDSDSDLDINFGDKKDKYYSIIGQKKI